MNPRVWPFRAGRLDAIAQPGDQVMLLGPAGPLGPDPFYEVQFVEPVSGLGNRGLTVIWNQGGTTMPAGYGSFPSGAASGTVNAGGQSNPSTPATLVMGVGQLLQFRWLIEPLALTGPVLQDIDILVNLPPAVARNGTLAVQGRWNMTSQNPSPSDTVVMPAQGSNKGLPAVYPALNQPDWNNLAELYIWENTYVPAFTVVNNGSANLSAGTIGIAVEGFRLDLVNLKRANYASGEWVSRRRFGIDLMVPVEGWVAVPIAGRGQATSGSA